jgi:hypothetical protein
MPQKNEFKNEFKFKNKQVGVIVIKLFTSQDGGAK